MKKKLLLLTPVLLGLLLTGCGGDEKSDSSSPKTDDTSSTIPSKKDFTGISWNDIMVTYDGETHILSEVSGVPEGTNVVYSGRESHTDAGTYNATAKLTKEGYNDKVLSAKLVINKADYATVSFANLSVVFDGATHILAEVEGAPEGTTVTYSGRNEYKNVGTYKATAKLSNKNYNDKTLSATLTITPATFAGLTYEDKLVTYDGADHISDIQLIGVRPEGTTVTEVVKNSEGQVVTSAIEAGTYSYTATLSNSNYNSKTLTATLTIKAQKKDMPVFVANDGTIYFANGLHEGYLYSYDDDAETKLKLIDYSSPKEFNKYSGATALFISGSMLLNSAKQVNSGATDVLYTAGNIDDFVKYSESIYYYSSNSFKAENSGIYKVDGTDSGNEPVVTKVFTGKSDNLAIYGDNLYFTNGNDDNHLYKMSLTTNATSLVMEEKVHEYVISNNTLYCTVNGTLNDYIGSLNLSSSSTKPTKLTNAAGEFLTVKNNYIYYNYTDLFRVVDESQKGVWRISLNGGDPEQVLQNNGVNGFDVQSGSLVYVDADNLHLYRYDLSAKTSVDLLDGFVAPESTPLNTGGRTISVGSKVFYLNMYANKTLYMYDESSKKSTQLTTAKVQDFYIYGDTLYFNQVTRLTNNDLYAVSLTNGGGAEKISSNDVRNIYSDGTYLYATHYNWAGTAGGIARMKLDGSEYTKFSEVNGAKNYAIKDNKLYYINCQTGQSNGKIEYISLSDITSTTTDLSGTVLSDDIKNVEQFEFEGDNIYYIYEATTEASVRRTDFTTLGEGTTIAKSKTRPYEMVVNGNYIYYYSCPISPLSIGNSGIYRVSKAAAADGTQELLLGYDQKYYATSLSISSSNNLYFLNYLPSRTLGDAHFYQLNLTSKGVTKIA